MHLYLYQNLILQSGLQAQGVFHGGLSVDVSADLAFSIFSQESKASVNNKYVKICIRSKYEMKLMSVCVTLSLLFFVLR